MSYLAILCIWITTAMPFEVTLAPDQVLPITYTNEPLIVSVSGPPNTAFEIIITITKPDGETITQFRPSKPETYLNGKYWIAVPDLPPTRGYFIANISIKHKNNVHEWEIPFCRIDRNTDRAFSPPFILHNPDETGLYLAQMLGIKEVSFDSDLSNLSDLVKKSVSFGERVIIVFNVDKYTSPIDIFEDLNNKLGGLVSTWEVAGNYSPEHLRNFSERVRKTKGIAVFRVSTSNIESLSKILCSVPEGVICEVSWCGPFSTIEDLRQLKDTITLHKGEGVPFSLYFGTENLSSDPIEQIRQIWIAKYAGARTLILPYFSLIKDGNISQLLSFLCGTTRIWTEEVEPLGWYSHSDEMNAFVFQSLSHWIMVFWGKEPLTLSGEGLATTQFFDSYGNPSTLPQVNENSLTIDNKSSPQYLIGNAYEVLYLTAVNELKTLAEEMNIEEFSSLKNQVITEGIKSIVQDPKNSQNRVHILNLFRELPRIEGQKEDTYESRARKRLFIAKLSEFLRCVCITEQYRGEPFREPLLDIIARSEEHLTEYLTGSSTTSEKDQRANWILEEVHRLIDRASKMTSNGKRIEAVGLAYLAESRAQSLEFLRQNPITTIDTNKVIIPASPVIAKKEEKTKINSSSVTLQDTTKQESIKAPAKKEELPETKGPLEHTVKKGETIASICKLYGITEEEFCAWNGIRKGAKLKTGKVYKIQIVRAQKPDETKPSEISTTLPAGESLEYIVQAGDYPGLIAKKLGVATAELLKANNLTEKSKLQIGQKLIIPGTKSHQETKPVETVPSKETAPEVVPEAPQMPTTTQTEVVKQETSPREEEKNYKLAPGDTPAIVAKKFGISARLLMEYNNIKDPTKLRAGQELRIPPSSLEKSQQQSVKEPEQKENEEKTPPPLEKEKTSETITHTVARGDNPYTISKKYGVPLETLLEVNKLTPESTLHIGQKLIIPNKKN